MRSSRPAVQGRRSPPASPHLVPGAYSAVDDARGVGDGACLPIGATAVVVMVGTVRATLRAHARGARESDSRRSSKARSSGSTTSRVPLPLGEHGPVHVMPPGSWPSLWPTRRRCSRPRRHRGHSRPGTRRHPGHVGRLRHSSDPRHPRPSPLTEAHWTAGHTALVAATPARPDQL